jgi:hypothetical protein
MNKKLPYYLLRSMQVFFIVVACFNTTTMHAQDSLRITPNGYLDTVIDNFGVKYSIRDLIVDDTLRAKYGSDPVVQPLLVQNCGSDYFELYFENGWEGNTGNESARRDVICRVAYDLSKFIQSPLTTTGEKVRIWVRNPANTGFTGFAAATPFHCVPLNSNISGIVDNVIWTTINSGTDGYTNVAPPVYTSNGTFFHGMIQINFGSYSFVHTLINPTFASSSENDLYTVVLHEMVHALGFYSLIKDDGTSQLGPNASYFTRYDTKLQTQGTTPAWLITNSGSCSMYNWAFNPLISTSVLQPNPSNTSTPDIPTCNAVVKYVGSTTTYVYTPDAWVQGASLSHFEDACPTSSQNDLYYVMTNESDGGANSVKRYPKPEERLALCDMGYKVNTTYGNNSTATNSYNNYGGSVCPGLQVAGINDGINNGMFTYPATAGVNTTLFPNANFLGNDGPPGLVTGFECLEDITPGTAGIINPNFGTTSTNVDYQPPSGFTGVRLLRYIPKNGTNKGNITYIYVYVGDPTCTNTCDMVVNGGFENSICGIVPFGGSVSCWGPIANTPDIFYTNCNNSQFNIPSNYTTPPTIVHPQSNIGNEHFLGLYGGTINDLEGIETKLTSQILNNNTYRLRFWAKNSNWNNVINSTGTFLLIGGSTGPLVPVTSGVPNGIVQLTPEIVIPNNNQWIYIDETFTYSGATLDYLNISNVNCYYFGNNCILPYMPSYVFIDDVSLELASTSCSFNLPSTMGLCEILSDLSDYVDIPGGVFAGPGVQLNGGVYSLNGVIAGTGLQTLSYTYTDNNGCTKTVYSQIQIGNTCIPCSAISNDVYIPIGLNGTITSGLGNNKYYLPIDATVSGNISFTDSKVLMAPGVKISVAPTSRLFLVSSHLYSCTDMWKGIELQDNGSSTGSLYTSSVTPFINGGTGTMIEDALTAVNIPHVHAHSGGGYVLSTDNSCFNKNKIAIDIADGQFATVGSLFRIQNTLFTGRDFSGFTNYPFAWPGNPLLKSPQAASPFQLNKKLCINYNGAPCKDTHPADIGIRLTSLGLTSGSTYDEIKIGEINTGAEIETNFFDSLHYGIYAIASNFSSVDNYFNGIVNNGVNNSGPIGGDGIYAGPATGATCANQARISEPAGNTYGNKFYNCVRGIEITGYQQVIGQKSYVINNLNSAYKGTFGYKVTTRAFNNVDLSSNTMYNVRTGIAFSATNTNQNLGVTNINSNVMGVNQGTGSGQFIHLGISADRGNGLITNSPITGSLTVNNNTLSNVYNGIRIQTFKQPSFCETNSITMVSNSLNNQAGISHDGTHWDFTGGNTLTGFGITGSIHTGIRSDGGTNHRIVCNNVLHCYEGFKFMSGEQKPTQWRGNNMTGNRQSFIVNFSRIGDQLDGGFMSENKWLTATGFSYTGTNYQAVAYNSTITVPTWGPAKSLLYVANNSTERPNANNFSSPVSGMGFSNVYALGVGITTSFKAKFSICEPAIKQGKPTDLVINQVFFGEFHGTENFIAQYDLWNALRAGDTLMEDTTGMLAEFYAMGDSCRFGMLARIDSVLTETGDTALVRSMIDDPALLTPKKVTSASGIEIADSTAANRVIDNYRKYYDLYLKYLGGTLNGDDSLRADSLGNLCVLYNGYAVYDARVLYNLLYEDMKIFTSECDTLDGGGSREAWQPFGTEPFEIMANKAVQQYNLLPNPNNGNFSIRQLVQDEQPVNAEVWNAIGARVFKGRLEFKAKKAEFRSNNLAPGNYLLKLNDSKGRHYTIKFTVL